MDNSTMSMAREGMSGEHEKPPKAIHHIKVKKVHGGHHYTHVHTHPESHPDEEHVTEGTDGMVGHMLDHASEPNPGEAEADAGQSGIPPAAGVSPGASAMPMQGA